MPNRLIDEPSLYLQQHAHNPVDWYPWGGDAFAEAAASDRPILVSIGYSSCHWCHVMERESFEDPEVAAFQNTHFVSVKVDREERPDVDRVYMNTCQLLTGGGGWPLNVFLLPDGRPFYAGTYFPPRSGYGRPSWRQLLEGIHDAYAQRRDEVLASAEEITSALRRFEAVTGGGREPGEDVVARTISQLRSRFDRVQGGFGRAPKFPSVMSVELLLREHLDTGDAELAHMVTLTLDRMADGGIHDQLGGGFARYSVDAEWAVPHFEKMLYDNGLLLRLYADGYRATGDPRYAEVLRDVAGWLSREMRAPEGMFYATLDADSEGEEGLFYVWTPDQIEAVVGAERRRVLSRFFGVTASGNFEHGATVLSRRMSVEELASVLSTDEAGARDWLDDACAELLAARDARVRPGRDEKRLTAWNALAIQGLARAGLVLGDAALVRSAEQAADALVAEMLDGDTLYRVLTTTSEHGKQRRIPGFLDDYGFVALALVELFVATGDVRHVEVALRVARAMCARFYDEAHETFRQTAADSELILIPRGAQDEAIPSGTGAAVVALQRLSELVGDRSLGALAEAVLRTHERELREMGLACTTLVSAAANALRGIRTVVVVLAEAEADVRELRAAVAGRIAPDDLVVMAMAGEELPSPLDSGLVEGRAALDGRTTYYVCRGGTCEAPRATL